MTAKQKRFCEEFVKTGNATQSAIKAGYSEKTANEQGARLLAKVSIKSYIQSLQAEIKTENIINAREMQEVLTSIILKQSEEDAPASYLH